MDRAAFIKSLGGELFGRPLTAKQASGVNAILDALDGWPVRWVAYALATAQHETAGTMQPIKEYGGPEYYTRMYDVKGKRPALAKRMGNTEPGDGVKYCGRGYVQLTWKVNYQKASSVTGVDLVDAPDAAMRPHIAAKIMRHGMEKGWFTGKKLSDYLNGMEPNYRDARKIINALDKAQEIADMAYGYEDALRAAGWGGAMPVGLMSRPDPVTEPPPVEPVTQVVIKNDPISTSSRTAQGTVTAGLSGAAITGNSIAEITTVLKEADAQISAGTWLMFAAGSLAIIGAAYAFYARWRDGGGVFPWEKQT